MFEVKSSPKLAYEPYLYLFVNQEQNSYFIVLDIGNPVNDIKQNEKDGKCSQRNKVKVVHPCWCWIIPCMNRTNISILCC